PRSFHMNEGHSAFLGLDLVRHLMEADSLSFEDAIEAAARRSVFTTHTPVPAGHDRFSPELMARYFTAPARSLGVDLDTLMALGREDPDDDEEPFTMTVLAIRLADQVNGVSRLHGAVSRDMWQGLWPGRSVRDVPIDHITNGVHLPSWVAPEVADLYGTPAAAMGVDERAPDPDPARLWETHGVLRRRLLDLVADRTGARLDPEALTIAFARRFATYKRATLILGDEDRLDALLNAPDGPVQLIFSGKAHPKDKGGKALIRRIGELAATRRFRDRLVFLPGYDMDIARYLVQGADVWLNNPRRPMEASGTSGMKAAANGILNVSILDGWWEEAWEAAQARPPRIGWSIGTGDGGDSPEQADIRDRDNLFRVLETEVVPTFFQRDGGVPGDWVAMMKEAVREVAPFFNTHRMLRDYTERYLRAAAEGVAGPR
ncbi:MAG TPA: alpha-glucan family phosphorylase, partial [Longimicrobiales bacterium]|nr:alpha-glucan family phosphorylase [Longimicrobiales bacterium]